MQILHPGLGFIGVLEGVNRAFLQRQVRGRRFGLRFHRRHVAVGAPVQEIVLVLGLMECGGVGVHHMVVPSFLPLLILRVLYELFSIGGVGEQTGAHLVLLVLGRLGGL